MAAFYGAAGGYEQRRQARRTWFEVVPVAHPVGLKDWPLEGERYVSAPNEREAVKKFKSIFLNYRDVPCRVKRLDDGVVANLRSLKKIRS